MSKKVALLMSGGVDSSYCAHLLKSQGYEVVGIYLKLHDKEAKHEVFIANCQKVSAELGIEFHILQAQAEFRAIVYDEFVNAYKRGETPNPCTLCNPLIKFGLALQEAKKLGCEHIATGHYAKITQYNGIKRIQKARDETKDQSYFLYALPQEAIDSIIFPLGDSLKAEIKPTALQILPFLGTLETYKDSQEICFVETDYIDVLKKHEQVEQKGIVRNAQGEVVGEHNGYMQYTIGKRKGFRVFGAHEPHYVMGINPDKNELIVGSKEELQTNIVYAANKSLNIPLTKELYEVKIRYRSTPIKARVSVENGIITAQLQESAYGVAKGQALVVYDGDVVLGGGVIV
ncbi:tRNA 2-thiouridine(34) synthase MnmA [uncultured Helicobacter sp.]|uniref:tRNA 2-thiouridine(34) synthase MnmA n=1 Tax=uncultured Helicobacter sp. TaxID=175537 RepID=UPI00374FF1A6